MRLSSGLLLAGASNAFGQFTRFTNTSTSAVESTTTSIEETTSLEATTTSSALPTEAEFTLNLKNAVLGPGASFYPPPDGESILLRPGSSSGARVRRQEDDTSLPTLIPGTALPPLPSGLPLPAFFTMPFSIPSYIWDPFFPIGPLFLVVSSVVYDSDFDRKRAEASDCVLEVLADGVVVAVEPINSSSQGSVEISSNPFRAPREVEFTYRQTCGSSSRIVGAIVNNVIAKRAPEGATATPIPSIPIRTEPVTGTNSEEATTNSDGETVVPTGTNSEGATTNSEGETVFPTDTAINTNSEGATTNSEGETIFPTETTSETVAETNSEGATTSSYGETTITPGTATGTATGTASSTSSTATSPAGFPGDIGVFSLFGCVGSTAGFPSFTLAQSSESMDLETCADLCTGRAYFGAYDTACYCGDVIDSSDTSRVTLDLCDIECPGDDTQFCGGDAISAKLHRRQNVPNSRLLTVYAAAEAAVTVTDSVTQTVTDQETLVTTYTTTVAGASSTVTQAVTATLVCFAGNCYSSSSSDVAVYIFIEINGSDCDGQWVYISEPCSCAGGQRYVPKFCSGGSCSGITVYKPQECHDWYNYSNFFVASDCDTCTQGKIMYQPWENSWGTPDNCNGDVPVCKGHECPSQHNGGGSQHGGHNGNGNSTAHGGSNGGYHPRPNGGSSSGSKGGSNGGSRPNSNGGPSSGSDQNPNASNGGRLKDTEPSVVPVISGAGKQAIGMLSLLAAIAALF
ncbi:hypothetical protein FPANT_10003 [Fusarium pseudoanthophilum]|uniref:WSC domain-containing protein n=1 Tax=Fusarium pseudoanthophilum TaxID=48495 RepID=A0A8H5NWL9_9HYPO|nr:hypothetical protein FPANT_10003 [Fusarium pseudoanthophilum]